MIGYRDRTYCGSDVEVHTCGREFTEQDAVDAERWWGGKDYPVAYVKFCEDEGITLPTGLGKYTDEELIAELKERGVVEFTTLNRGQLEFSTGKCKKV